MPPVTVMKMVGHSDFTTTANIYTDLGVDVMADDLTRINNKNYLIDKYENGTE
ncbi:MAG: hypothetical protein ACI4EL_01525 [Candidatus Fimimorpha sp.]